MASAAELEWYDNFKLRGDQALIQGSSIGSGAGTGASIGGGVAPSVRFINVFLRLAGAIH